jgi:ribosomal protein S18 acetylase RimI-like enzyme
MSANHCPVKSDVQITIREVGREDLENPGLLSQYFLSADPGIGRELETTAMRSVLAAGRSPGRTGLFADAMDGAVGCLIAEEKPWDSAMLSVATSNLTVLASLPKGRERYEIASRMLEHWLSSCPNASAGLLSIRIPSDDTNLLHSLEDHGFLVQVPMVTLGRTLEKVESVLPDGIRISVVEPGDIDQAENIAATAFRWGRFSADPMIQAGAAEKVHRTWARNCCLGTHAKHVLVARKQNEVLGFIALKFQMAGAVEVGSIELIAISETSRGTGIGRALVQAGCNWLYGTVKHVVVRTELPNIPALRLYEARGFRILNGSLYLSRWAHPVPAS